MNYIIFCLLITLAISQPCITGYWEGYPEHKVQPYPISQVSENVSIIPIAFVAPTLPISPSNFSTQYSFGISQTTYMPETIYRDIKRLKQKSNSPKVLLSLMDTPDIHWQKVDLEIFTYNLMTLIENWNLDGVDIDAESQMPQDKYVETFVSLVKTLRKHLGPDRLITYTTYDMTSNDQQILSRIKDDIDIVHLMAYWDSFDSMIDEFQWYGNLVNDYNKISIGVAVTQTSLDTIKQIGNWLRDNHYNKMMLWSVTQDVFQITNNINNVFIDTIYESLSNSNICLCQ